MADILSDVSLRGVQCRRTETPFPESPSGSHRGFINIWQILQQMRWRQRTVREAVFMVLQFARWYLVSVNRNGSGLTKKVPGSCLVQPAACWITQFSCYIPCSLRAGFLLYPRVELQCW